MSPEGSTFHAQPSDLSSVGLLLGTCLQIRRLGVRIPLVSRVDRLSVSARGAEVDQLDGGALGVAQQYVLGLEVAVDDRHVAQLQEAQRLHNLLAELAHEARVARREAVLSKRRELLGR